MEILPDIIIVDTALYIKPEKVLIISDLHIGYEEALHHKGVLLPKTQLKTILLQLKHIFIKVKPKIIVINGDLKHEFGKILRDEWSDALKVIDFLLKHCQKVIVIQGNHDPLVTPITQKRNITVVQEYRVRNICITHGDALVETNAKILIIGHEHPAITLREKSKYETYKCFLQGTWKRKKCIVMPSFNPLLEGTNVLKERLLSPFLNDIKHFTVFIVSNNKIFNFGKIKNL
ncbi:phosphoesterase [Candidatus Woesearchaeota archaeon CG10_big_fil_rev_8_21_14_0_10_36_11]|nr:MAG: phosphoesterase [Candidatus Woesearchaeota archaeon CG10_big_fil_rev_8_21_14_0_10_36_11]